MFRALSWLSLFGILVVIQNAPTHSENVAVGGTERCNTTDSCDNNFVCNATGECHCEKDMIVKGSCLVHRHSEDRTESTVVIILHILKSVVPHFSLSTSQTAETQGNGTEKVNVSFIKLKPGQEVWAELTFLNITFPDDFKTLQYTEKAFSLPATPESGQHVWKNPGKMSLTWNQKGLCDKTVCKLCPQQKSEDLCVSFTGPTCDVNGTEKEMSCEFTFHQDVKYDAIIEVYNGDGDMKSQKFPTDYYFSSKPILNASIAGLGSRSVDISMKVSCTSFALDVAFVMVNISRGQRCLVFRSDNKCGQQSKPSALDECEDQRAIATDVCEPGHEHDFILSVPNLTPSNSYTLQLMPWYCSYSSGNENNSFVLSALTNATEPWNVTGVYLLFATHTNITVVWPITDPDPGPVNFTMLISNCVDRPKTSSAICSTKLTPCYYSVPCQEPRNKTTGTNECTADVPYAFWIYNIAILVSTGKGTSSPLWSTAKNAPAAPGPVPVLDVTVKNLSHPSSRCGNDQWRDYNEICVTWKEICPYQRRNFIHKYQYTLVSPGKINISGEIVSADWNETSYFKLLKVTIDTNYTFCVKATSMPTDSYPRPKEGEEKCTDVYVPSVKPVFSSEDSYRVQAKDIPKQNYWCSVSFNMTSTCFASTSKFGDIVDDGLIVSKGVLPKSIELTEIHSWGDRDKYNYYMIRPSHIGADHTGGCNVSKTIVIGDETCSNGTETYCNGPLEPATNYSVYAFVCTHAGCSTTLVVENILTAEPVTDLTVSIKNIEAASRCGDEPWDDYSDVCVKWKETCPHQATSFILKYHYRLVPPDGEKTSILRLNDGGKTTNIDNEWKHFKLVNVTTDTNYTFCLKATALENNDEVPETCTQVYVASRVPQFPSGDHYKVATKDIPKQTLSRRVTFSMKSSCFMYRSPYGKVEDNGFIVSKGPFTQRTVDPTTMPSWNERQAHSFYKVKPSYFSPASAASCDTQRNIVIGNETCGLGAMRTTKYCDGPLDSGTTYSINAMVCTRAGCSTTLLVDNISTPAEEVRQGMPIHTLVAICIAPVILPALAFLVYLAARNKKARRDKTAKMMPWGPTVIKLKEMNPVPLSKLENVIKKKEEHNKLNEEFKAIEKLTKTYPYENCMLECNRPKNRFADIVAYDHSRVELTPQGQEEGSDYINANFIPGYSREGEYIAMQGPLSRTKDDVWRMVWEYRVPMIVMLTQTQEKGRIICDQYWTSTPGEVKKYGHITVTTAATSAFDDYVITRLFLSHQQDASETLQVLHLQYLIWPDMTADVSVESVVNFLLVSRHLLPDSSRPLVVHCSAGVGRTGTFICLDYVMQFIQKKSMNDKLDIFGFVLRMRENRCRMVQTVSQYIFIHQVARRLIAARRNPSSWKGGSNPFAPGEAGMSEGKRQLALPPPTSEESVSASEATDLVEADMREEDVTEVDKLLRLTSL